MDVEKTAQTEAPKEVNTETKNPAKVNKSRQGLLAVIIVLLVAGGAGAYWMRDRQAKKQLKDNQAQIALLTSKITDLEKTAQALATAKKDVAVVTPPVATKVSPSASAIANIKASITSGNTAALEGYMASSVRVLFAASDGIFDRTPVKAIEDLKFLDSATAPWDFSLDAVTLAKYGAGDYKQYFPADAVVGKSANKYVISFNFDNAGKINVIFMSASSDLL